MFSVRKTALKRMLKPVMGMCAEVYIELGPCAHLHKHVHIHMSISMLHMLICVSVHVCWTLAPRGLFKAIQDSGSLLSDRQLLLPVT